ncbi:N-glycosylation protein-domain-containing protein [Rhodocollybia butyracea]|uniref:N-glycosylation protein-domain-containing protein n=1 Tax=Rhodocollybia butyracea TaxID=206335 RepID=A0A9P5Q403_9AGAR|nr:N-glycosylation protein-domain-containing protein [Rhodocollybia butyracea]
MLADDSETMIQTSTSSARPRHKRFRLFGSSNTERAEKFITTRPGSKGAGETETEVDEPPRHLPTSRKVTPSPSVRLTPLLFEFSRLLSVVPALCGVFYLAYHVRYPPDSADDVSGRRPPDRVDFLISILWALLTAHQCLSLTTGLLTRWRLYYPPLATLIRLVSLQAICWPATHFTLAILEHRIRPVIAWAVIGTTTCLSRSVQIWVTSNLWWEGETQMHGQSGNEGGIGIGSGTSWQRLKGGKWGGRRWDWSDVVKKCMLPAGVVYCVMAWVGELRREWSEC